MSLAPLLSSARHDWQTPGEILELVRQVGPIALDPCTSADNPTGARMFFTEEQDGLGFHWPDFLRCEGDVVYANPPYGRALAPWSVQFVFQGPLIAKELGHLITLTPARTDTGWYDALATSCDALCEWRGRVTFRGAPHPAPFPSALAYWGPRPYLFADIFAPYGRIRL